MWKIQTSKTVSNNAQDVLCSKNTMMEKESMTYAVIRHVFVAEEGCVDITSG
jgi:hypothetical protein